MNLLPLLEEFLRIMNRDENIPILVEGYRDLLALRYMGFKSQIYTLNNKPLLEICYEISRKHKKVYILFDFDKRGKFLYRKTKRYLSELGVVVDDTLRDLFKKFGISKIEEIRYRIKNLVKNDKYFYLYFGNEF